MKSARFITCYSTKSSSSRDIEVVKDVFFSNANVVVFEVAMLEAAIRKLIRSSSEQDTIEAGRKAPNKAEYDS